MDVQSALRTEYQLLDQIFEVFSFWTFGKKKEGILVIIYLGYAEVTRLGF